MRPLHMPPARALLLGLAALTLPGGPVRAQQAPAPRPTLAQALAALEPPKQDLFLSVGADKIELPPNTPPPDPADRPGAVGETYGRLLRDFGGITALAPPTMVVLNARPGVPDPYDGMPPEDALKLLLAGLSPPQWDALMGENGLGMADLSDDSQRDLFRQVLPSGGLTATREYSPLIHTRPWDWEPVTLAARDLDAARLRLGRRMTIDVPLVGQGDTGETSLNPLVSGTSAYNAEPTPGAPPGMIYGAFLSQTLANNPKDADLDYNAPALKRSIRVDGLATVGDLIARVGQAAGLELYADRRYETRRVTLVGRRAARAVDLLRAVAFCVTGTFRRVGPAYVLTDDLQGTATRRQRLARFVQQAEMTLSTALAAAEDGLAAAHGGADALPWLGGAGFSDAQQALPEFIRAGGSGVTVTFAQLTPAQRDLVLGYSGVDRDRPFRLHARTSLLLLSPAALGPVFLSNFPALSEIFQLSNRTQMKVLRQRAVEDSWKNYRRQLAEIARKNSPLTRPHPLSPSAVAALLAPIPRRAVLVAPRTAAEVDAVVAEMKVLGLNQLWLAVFVGGRSRLAPGSGPDILTEALARTKGTGISVIPALDLLRWGVDAPAGARDLTALGETSAEQEAWRQHYRAVTEDKPSEEAGVPTDVWACPAAAATEETLLALVRRLAATPGVTTLAVRDTTSPDGLGYAPAPRLALLRRAHLDPVDLDAGYNADTSLPEFDDIHFLEHGQILDQARSAWNRLRDAASRDLLRHLLAAAQETGRPRFRFLVQQRGESVRQAWYGLWENPQAPLPEVPVVPPGPGPRFRPWETDYAPIAHSQCRINLIASGLWAAGPYAPAVTPDKLSAGWDGVVLDATGPLEGDTLARLARGVKP